MLRTGDVLHHPSTGERLTVIGLTPTQLVLEDVWPGQHVVPAHRHPTMTERWRICEGRVAITIDGAEHVLGPDEEAEAPAGVVHTARNLGQGPARVRMTLHPPGRWLEFVERLFRGDDLQTLLRAYPDELAPP